MEITGSSAVLVITTTASEEEAQRIGKTLVEKRLAGCVQIEGPIRSVYRWHDQVDTAIEWRLQVKTLQAVVPSALRELREQHSYDEPELIVVPILGCSPTYLRWLADQIADPAVAFLLYSDAAGSPFEIDFESTLSGLSRLPRMFLEPDGSFVWRPEDSRASQIDGMVYDAGGRVRYFEIKGQAPGRVWKQLLGSIMPGAAADAARSWVVQLQPHRELKTLEKFFQEHLIFHDSLG